MLAHDTAPPLSPALVAGMLIPPFAYRPAAPLLALAIKWIFRRHADLFSRLGPHVSARFVIDPLDLPFAFLLLPDPKAPRLTLLESLDGVTATATIRGPLLALIDLLEGRVDGDALFFSRRLRIEGSMEAVLALRNAVDGAGIDLHREALALLGPFAGPADRLTGQVAALGRHLARNAGLLHGALLAPVTRRTETQEHIVSDLANRLRSLEERSARRLARGPK